MSQTLSAEVRGLKDEVLKLQTLVALQTKVLEELVYVGHQLPDMQPPTTGPN